MAASRATQSRVSTVASGGSFYGSRLRLTQPQQLLASDPPGDELEVAVRNQSDLLDLPVVAESIGELGELARILQRGTARVDHAGEQELAETLRHVGQVSPVEIDPDRIDRQLGQALLERFSRVAEGQLQGER